MNPTLTQVQVRAVVTMLRDVFGDDQDEQLLLDTLEGETDLFENVRRLLDRMERDEGDKAALAEQIEARKVRKDRADARIKASREAIGALMECAGIDKLQLPEATLSLRKLGPKLVVTNPDDLPDEFCTFTKKPNLAAIKDADGPIPGTAFDNGGVSLTVRRK